MWRRMNASPEEQVEKFMLLHNGIAAVWQHPIVDLLAERIRDLKEVVPAR